MEELISSRFSALCFDFRCQDEFGLSNNSANNYRNYPHECGCQVCSLMINYMIVQSSVNPLRIKGWSALGQRAPQGPQCQ